MDVELEEVRDFVAACSPFDTLPPQVQATVPKLMDIRYARRGTPLLTVGDHNDQLFLVRSGAVAIRDADGHLVEQGEAGSTFGTSNLLHGGPSQYDVAAVEDCLLLVMEGADFRRLAGEHPAFQQFFVQLLAARLRGAVEAATSSRSGHAVLRTRVAELVRRAPVSVPDNVTIRRAAETMTQEGVSSLLVTGPGGRIGIVTDRDLRSRVVASGRSTDEPVAAIMTADPVTVGPDALAFEALMEMVERGIHHLPVLDSTGAPLGLVTGTDLLRLEHASPVHLVSDIRRQQDLDSLARAAARVPLLVEQLVTQDATAADITRLVTAVGDAVERRVVELAVHRLGPAPVAFSWVVLGSRARHEQALSADQDNALVIADDLPAGQEDWFVQLAEQVVDGLERCGYRRCPGDVMATNPQWRQTFSQWRATVAGWLREPDPDAVLGSTIFFDMRPVAGDLSLGERLHRWAVAQVPGSAAFLAHARTHALDHEPPLGFFRGLVLQKEGEHKDTLDLKVGGVGAIVELVRVQALAHGLSAVTTRERITALERSGVIGSARADDLRDALEFVGYVRLRHQARQVREGGPPDNFVAPEELSSFERRHLKDAFQVVRQAQSTLARAAGAALP